MTVNTGSPLVSIIVPIYNVQDYLDACMQSLMRQTYSNVEIILVNDGSLDASGQMCDDYQRSDNRIVAVHKKNGGLSDARNVGLDICKGEYITFVDSDDVVHHQYIEMLLNSISDSDFVYCDYRIFVEDNKISPSLKTESGSIKQFPAQDAYSKLMQFDDALIVVAWNKLYRRHIWGNLRYKVGVLYEDEHIIHHIIYRSEKISFLDNILVYYRQREQSITSNKGEAKSFLDKLAAYYNRYRFFIDQGMEKEASTMLGFIFYRCAMRTVSADNEIWKSLNSLRNIFSVSNIRFNLKMVLLLKKYMYPLYTILYDLKKKV